MSGTKAIVGLIAGILHRNGDLNLGSLVSDYVPEIGKTGYHDETIRQLLDMRASVTFDDEHARAYGTAVHGKLGAPDEAVPSLHEFLQTLTLGKAPHGGPFSYVSPNTDLIGSAIERATGKAFPTLLSELLWQHMGTGHAANVIVDREGSLWCSGGLSATVRDLARLGDLLVNDGWVGANEIVPKAWIDDLCDNGDRGAWKDGEWGKSFAAISGNMSYRAGWYAVHDDPKHIFAMGVHGQNLFVDRTNHLVIAKLSSQASRIDAHSIGLTHMAVAELRRCVMTSQR